MSIADHAETKSPSEADVQLARESSRALARFVGLAASQPPRLRIQSDTATSDEETVSVPADAFRLLVDILNQMAQGNAVTITPVHAELTTQQAAEILNVSRPFVIKLIEENKLPCRLVGTHRRVRYDELLRYKHRVDSERLKVLAELAAQAQELNMGY